jgi:hypothetical protein
MSYFVKIDGFQKPPLDPSSLEFKIDSLQPCKSYVVAIFATLKNGREKEVALVNFTTKNRITYLSMSGNKLEWQLASNNCNSSPYRISIWKYNYWSKIATVSERSFKIKDPESCKKYKFAVNIKTTDESITQEFNLPPKAVEITNLDWINGTINISWSSLDTCAVNFSLIVDGREYQTVNQEMVFGHESKCLESNVTISISQKGPFGQSEPTKQTLIIPKIPISTISDIDVKYCGGNTYNVS